MADVAAPRALALKSSGDRPDDAQNARERLFAAALESFSTKGFHGTTTRDIARAAGLSPAAMYVHYSTKEDLLYAISKAGHDWSLAVVRSAAASATDPVQQLAALAHDFTLEHAQRHTRARIVNYELAALSPEHRAEIVAIRRAIEAQFYEVLQAGADTGQFVIPDVRMTTRALVSLGVDTARWFMETGRWTAEQVAQHHSLMALRMVGAAP